MDISFDYSRDRQYYALRFSAGPFESVPFLRELRLWGVDRFPCPRLSTLAALIALKDHPVEAIILQDIAMNPPICTALSNHFDVEIHPAKYDNDRRDLAGGEKIVAPMRFSHAFDRGLPGNGAEALTWISLDDLGGPFGGTIRTNVDAFDLTESEKNLIVALCCAGKDVGHIILGGVDPGLSRTIHSIGLELIDDAAAA